MFKFWWRVFVAISVACLNPATSIRFLFFNFLLFWRGIQRYLKTPEKNMLKVKWLHVLVTFEIFVVAFARRWISLGVHSTFVAFVIVLSIFTNFHFNFPSLIHYHIFAKKIWKNTYFFLIVNEFCRLWKTIIICVWMARNIFGKCACM